MWQRRFINVLLTYLRRLTQLSRRSNVVSGIAVRTVGRQCSGRAKRLSDYWSCVLLRISQAAAVFRIIVTYTHAQTRHGLLGCYIGLHGQGVPCRYPTPTWGRVFTSVWFIRTISQKPIQLGSTNFTYKSPWVLKTHFLGSEGQMSRSRGTKQYRRAFYAFSWHLASSSWSRVWWLPVPWFARTVQLSIFTDFFAVCSVVPSLPCEFMCTVSKTDPQYFFAVTWASVVWC